MIKPLPFDKLDCFRNHVRQYDSAKLGAELGEEFLLVDQTQEMHITPAGKKQKFGYFRLIRQG